MYSPTLRTEQSAAVVVIYFPTPDSGMNRMLLIKLVLAAGAGGAAARFASDSNGHSSGPHQVAAAFVPATAENLDAPSSSSYPPDVFSSRDMHADFAFFRNKGRMKEVDAGVPMSRLLLRATADEERSLYRIHPWNNSEYLGADTITRTDPPLLQDSVRTSTDSTCTSHALDCFVRIEDLFALYVPIAKQQRDSVMWTIMRTSGAIAQRGISRLEQDTLFIPLLRLPKGITPSPSNAVAVSGSKTSHTSERDGVNA